jgi:hypothetical protein
LRDFYFTRNFELRLKISLDPELKELSETKAGLDAPLSRHPTKYSFYARF